VFRHAGDLVLVEVTPVLRNGEVFVERRQRAGDEQFWVSLAADEDEGAVVHPEEWGKDGRLLSQPRTATGHQVKVEPRSGLP